MEINTVGVTSRFVTLEKQDSYMTVSYFPMPTFIHSISSINLRVDVYNIHPFHMDFGIRPGFKYPFYCLPVHDLWTLIYFFSNSTFLL